MFRPPLSFDEHEVIAHSDIADEFAEMWVHISTVKKPNYGPQEDKTKPQYMLPAIFENEAKSIRLGLEETNISSRDPTLYVQRCVLEREIINGDWFQRCRSGDLYQVVDVKKDGASGVEVALTQLGRHR